MLTPYDMRPHASTASRNTETSGSWCFAAKSTTSRRWRFDLSTLTRYRVERAIDVATTHCSITTEILAPVCVERDVIRSLGLNSPRSSSPMDNRKDCDLLWGQMVDDSV